MPELNAHPVAALFPLLGEDERYALTRANIWLPNFAVISPRGITPREALALNLITVPHGLSW